MEKFKNKYRIATTQVQWWNYTDVANKVAKIKKALQIKDLQGF